MGAIALPESRAALVAFVADAVAEPDHARVVGLARTLTAAFAGIAEATDDEPERRFASYAHIYLTGAADGLAEASTNSTSPAIPARLH